ncbi:hypothetical protein ED733_000085 [Metarhizium rileyi]|uniref:Uncharacterized protein n=1 Tax=Metarhizium rileyi (strain RCEF 4871) TaxID=1649241 RepID=A0A5C6G341_METRR|nr:hypothetical protein ED733_000085 [Metarhizium rileyi]
MALPEDAESLLLNEGFFLAEDTALGHDISKMERRRFPHYSEYGLEFRSQCVLNQHVCPVITTFFDGQTCVLAHWLRYKAYPGHILCFRKGGPKAGRRRLVIQLLAKGSKVAY